MNSNKSTCVDHALIQSISIQSRSLDEATMAEELLPITKSAIGKGRFAKSALVTAVSSLMLISTAYAATASETDSSKTPDSQNTEAETEEVSQALDALRLKKAVENGVIDPSVLEAYQQETLKKTSSSNPSLPNRNSNNTNSNTRSDANKAGMEDSVELSVDNTDLEASLDEAPSLISEEELNQQASQLQQKGYQMMSPAEIDAQLGTVNDLVQQAAQFDNPVSTLDDESLPIGFDADLNATKFPTPSNAETLGIDTTPTSVATRPVEVSDAVSSTTMDSLNEVNKLNARDKNLIQDASHSIKGSDQLALSDQQVEAAKQQNPSQVAITPPQKASAVSGDSGDIKATSTSARNKKSTSINPDEYLPDYQTGTETEAVAESLDDSHNSKTKRAGHKGNVFKRLYNRYFNDGYEALPHIETTVYFEQESEGNAPPKLVKADEDIQPINNIKAALDDITAQSIRDFTGAVPRLRQTALNAAKAVGYYDVTLRIQRVSEDQIDVIIENLGEPVIVDSRVIDVRGEGGETPEFQVLEDNLPPQKGDIFNHGVYKSSKAALEKLSNDYGYFDKYWLNKSVDVILPDNTADVDLIYNTGDRYEFDDVVFFTYDEETNELTTDPDKLPVKPELLRQLVNFNAGDDYYRPNVTKLSNDLSATRYFNTVNVEAIMPADVDDTGTLGFDNSTDDPNTVTTNDDLTVSEGKTGSPVNDNNNTAVNDTNANATLTTERGEGGSAQKISEEDIAPISFEVDEQTREKLLAIKKKAERLASLPDDRVLDEKSKESKNLLGKISDSVSSIAEKIFPDDPDEEVKLKPEKLAGKATPQDVKQSKKIPLYVYVASEKPRDAQVGIGYGTDTGVRATAKVDYNLINRDGYQAGFEVAASRINKNASIYAKRPWKHPLDDTLNANLSYEEELIDQGKGNFELSTKTLQAALSRNIHRESGWDRTYSVRYRQDELDTDLDKTKWEDLPVRFKSSKPTQQALLLGYGMSKLDVDNVSNPSMGYRQYYALEAGSESALTDTNMAIARAGLRGIYTFGEDKRHQVLGKLDAGYIWADDFYEVPYKLRFFAGGDQSIRGFDYNSLSPIENGYLTGGQVLAVGSAEYNYEFKPGFRAAVFTDVGNAYDSNFETDTKVGVGVGVRWASPIGVVRLDVAAGVTEESIPVRLHFFIGSPL